VYKLIQYVGFVEQEAARRGRKAGETQYTL
jgi:hypothetical protein